MKHNLRKHLSSFQIIIIGFALLILCGCLLLMLPFSTRDGNGAGFFDALFTATSAACVTGLVVQDTATYWSLFGQIVILILIQIGGMGIVTSAIAISLISGKRIGLVQRSAMQETIAAPKVGGIVRLTGFVLKAVIIIELAGTVAFATVFCRDFGFFRGVWYSMFHSVSAFCNAGFDLMGAGGKYSSLTVYADNPVINITVMLLIVIGGLGFITWDDIRTHKFHLHKYRMQSKVILTVTAALIILPALYFFLCDFADRPLPSRVLYSLFQSVTTRTAGFNTVNLNAMRQTSLFVMIILMLVGGSPGSTAGGMKTTTLAVMLSSALSVFRRKENASFFKRRISNDVVRSAAAVFGMYITIFIAGAFIISHAEGLPLFDCMYETASAIGTVGLTTGITPGLGAISHTVLILLMFFGRVGGLTIVFAAVSPKGGSNSKFPEEKITVG